MARARCGDRSHGGHRPGLVRARPRGMVLMGAPAWRELGGRQRGPGAESRNPDRGGGPLPGGVAGGFEIEPGIWLDKFYHHLFQSDRHAIGLINELGLGDDLLWRRPLTVTLRDGTPHQLDSPISLLRFGPLPLLDRIRMGAWLAYLRTLGSADRLEGHTAAEWIRRRMGARAYEVVWGPLLRGKFGALADEIAMPWFWARVHDRTAQLGYLRGGFQRLYDRLAERITQAGGTLPLGTQGRGIRSDPSRGARVAT